MSKTEITLEDGKYTVAHEDGVNLRALRYGQPWRDLTGDGLVLAMAQEIESLRLAMEFEREQAKHRLNEVYAQRNALAVAFAKAAIAAGWKAGRGVDSGFSGFNVDPAWANVVYVQLPDGRQVSWHVSPDCAHMVTGLPAFPDSWDGTYVGRDVNWSTTLEARPVNKTLLEALQACLGWLEWLDDPRSGLGSNHKSHIKMASKAIAFATGEQQ